MNFAEARAAATERQMVRRALWPAHQAVQNNCGSASINDARGFGLIQSFTDADRDADDWVVVPVEEWLAAIDAGHVPPLPTNDTVKLARILFEDGQQQIELPAWHKVPVVGGSGNAARPEGPDLRVLMGGTALCEVLGYVRHSWGRNLIFGAGWNGEAPHEVARYAVMADNTFIPIYIRTVVPVYQSELLSFYISSDFPWSAFAWHSGEVVLTQAEDFGWGQELR